MIVTKKRIVIVGTLAACLLTVGIPIAFISTRPHNPISPPATQIDTSIGIQYSTDTPDEQRPKKDEYIWIGNPHEPKYLTLPSIGTEGYMQNVDIDQNQEVAVPNNVHMAGWFVQSERPGDKGLSIIDGHVDGRTSPGIFSRLPSMKPGDEFSVTFGDDSLRRFKVLRSASIDVKDVPAVLFSKDPGIDRQLNLITCTGVFDKTSRRYNQRAIVTATFQEN